MDSRELLELLEYMDDDGQFKTALRQGEPSRHRKAIFQIANELAVLRAVQTPGVDGDQWDSQFFFSPAKLRELTSTEDVRSGARDAIFAIGAQSEVN